MSNLLKTGFQSFKNSSKEPFVIDVNSYKFNEAKIIRSVDEKNEQDNSDSNCESLANEAVLNDALDKAKLLRDDAMLKAAKIISDAEIEAETIKEQAYQEGYDKGLEDGNMEAMKRADIYLENIQKEQDAVIAENNKKLEEALVESEAKLVDFSCTIIEKLTGILVDEYKPVMLHMINNALKEAETSRSFLIMVSEDSYAYILENSDRIVGASNPGIKIEIYADPNLQKNQCMIESDNGIIDLSMDVQIKNLVTAIKLLSE
ncbi:MAG: FliH/SctL family protein [Wujia sp.]